MTGARKLKISVTIDGDLVDLIDGEAAKEGGTRSALMERWLRQMSTRAKLTRLAEETATYYESLTAAERAEDAALAAASSRAARNLQFDDLPEGHRPRRKRTR